MAINPGGKYPGQVATDANYPYGKARNESTVGARDGFPLEEAWVNDLLGFQQALLGAAGLTPSGAPDRVGASQYLESISALVQAAAFNRSFMPWRQAQLGLITSASGVTEAFGKTIISDDGVIVAASACVISGTGYLVISSSEDGGVTFVDRLQTTEVQLLGADFVSGFVPGEYAVIVVDDERWLHAAYPYRTWTEVSAPTFASGMSLWGQPMVVATIEGVPSLAFVQGSALFYTPAATEPTAPSNWQSVDLSGLGIEVMCGFATDGNTNVIVGSVPPTNTALRVLRAPVASGGDPGDWSGATLQGSASQSPFSVIHTGDRFLLSCGFAVRESLDGITWLPERPVPLQGMLSASPYQVVLLTPLNGNSGGAASIDGGRSFFPANGGEMTLEHGYPFDVNAHGFLAFRDETVPHLMRMG